MGDHVPAFLMRDFRADLGPDLDETSAEIEDDAPEVAAAPEAPEAEVAAPKPRAPRRRGPAKKTAAAGEAEAPPSAA
ncbi:MAG: hypothetical protein H0T41_01030 [Rhodobacteraceae bacterium]|nr:hypothetical protein [Paracoccaceae bacterium]